MTNEEKAFELVLKITSKRIDLIPSARNDAYDAAMQMAAWKDQQFEKEREALISNACEEYKKDLLLCQTIICNINKTAKELMDIKGSVCNFRKAMEETK